MGAIPAGFELAGAGAGSSQPEWSADSTGSTPNLTVLRPTSGSSADDVLISADGGDEGFPANTFVPANGEQMVDYLLRAKGDVQFSIRGRTDRHTLDAVARSVTMPDRKGAPVVADPPGDLEVVGSVTADAALALSPYFVAGTGSIPGPSGAHVAAWQRERVDVVVATLPGGSIDLDVLADHPRDLAWSGATSERRTIAGRPGVVLRGQAAPEAVFAQNEPVLVIAETGGGDIAVVAATIVPVRSSASMSGTLEPPAQLPSVEALGDVAASIRSVDEVSWSRFVEKAKGGPGFHADPGAVMLHSGERSGIGWILQDTPGADPSGGFSTGPDGSAFTAAVSGCLKLSNGERPCLMISQGGAGAPGEYLSIKLGTSSVGTFAIVERSRPGGRLRSTTSAGIDERPMVAVPGESRWVGVGFIDQAPAPLRCPTASAQAVLEVAEEDGTTTCLGASF